MLGLWFYQKHAGNDEALLHVTCRAQVCLPSPSQNGLALGWTSLPHGTKHRIHWEKPFVFNQEHCFLLEKLHPAWRDFSCSWMRQGGHLVTVQALGSGSWSGQRQEPCQWAGDSHPSSGCAWECCSSALQGQGLMWQPCTPMSTMSVALPHARFGKPGVGLWPSLSAE